MNCGIHRFNVLLQMGGNAVLLTGYVWLSRLVPIHIVPRLKQLLGLVNEGVLTDPRGAACLSTVITGEDLDRTVVAFDRVLGRLAP